MKEEEVCKICNGDKKILGTKDDHFMYTYDIVTDEPIYLKKCVCTLEKEFERMVTLGGLQDVIVNIRETEYETKYDWQKHCRKVANDFISNDSMGLIISGQTGSGKTLLLGKTLLNFISKGKNVMYHEWLNSKHKLINQFGKQDPSQVRYMELLCDIEVLYIDDALKVRGNSIEEINKRANELDVFWAIISRRIAKGKKTMISTELFQRDFETIDGSLRGRLQQLTGNEKNWLQIDHSADKDIRSLIHNDKFK